MDSSGSNKRFRSNQSQQLSISDIKAGLRQIDSERRSEEKIRQLEAEISNLKLKHLAQVNQKNFGPNFTYDILGVLYVREGTITEKLLELEKLVLAQNTLDSELDRHIAGCRKMRELVPDPWRRLKLTPENPFSLPPPPLPFSLQGAQTDSNSQVSESTSQDSGSVSFVRTEFSRLSRNLSWNSC